MDITNIEQQIELLNTIGYTLVVEERYFCILLTI
jgi:hypothetical protein